MAFEIFVSANQKEMRKERFAIKTVVNSNETIRRFFDVFFIRRSSGQGEISY